MNDEVIADWMREVSERLAKLEEAAMHSQCIPHEEIERLRRGYDRYETARRMTPNQWADAWALNLKTGKPFDEIIDGMREAMFPYESAETSREGHNTEGMK